MTNPEAVNCKQVIELAAPASVQQDLALRRFTELIEPLLPRLLCVILFGSRARGDARPDSDYDLLIVVPEQDFELEDRLYDATVQVLIKLTANISLKIYTQGEFEHRLFLGTRFIRNALREGVVLWTQQPLL